MSSVRPHHNTSLAVSRLCVEMVPPAVASRATSCLRHDQPGRPPLQLVSDAANCDAASAGKWLDRDPAGSFPQQFEQRQLLAWPPREDTAAVAGGMSPSMADGASSGRGWLVGSGPPGASAAEEEGSGVVARLRADIRALDQVCVYALQRHYDLLGGAFQMSFFRSHMCGV